MNHKNLLTLQSVLFLLSGLATLIVPNQFIAPFGQTLQVGGVGISRLYGATILTLAVITWAARSSGPSEARKAIVLGLFVGNLLGAIMFAFNGLAGGFGPLVWANVLVFLLLAAAFGYLFFTKPEEA